MKRGSRLFKPLPASWSVAGSIVAAVVGLIGGTSAFGYQEAAVSDPGTVVGRVSFQGKVPEPQHFLVQKNPEVCGKEFNVAFVRAVSGALQDVAVVLEGVEQGKPFVAPPTEIAAKGCAFLPYVTTTAKKGAQGWPIFKIENKDPVMHNPHIYEVMGAGRRTLWNVGLPEQGSKIEKELRVLKGKVIKIECDQHDFMHSWVRIVENPYFAMVGRDGSFRMDGVPPGRYKLVAWHPTLGEQTREVTVASSGMTTADVTFPAK